MVTVLMMSAKLDALDLLAMKVFLNEGCDFIIFIHDITNKILSRDPNYIVDTVM